MEESDPAKLVNKVTRVNMDGGERGRGGGGGGGDGG